MSNRYLYLTAIALCLPLLVRADTVELADEAAIPVPAGWSLITTDNEYPFQLAADDFNAELLIFRHEIESGDAVGSESELKRTVDNVLADVLPFLPESQILSNTGFVQGGRAGFVLEFISKDTAAGVWIRHRLEELIYRHPDGHQLLFTLWARSAAESWASYENAVQLAQDGFTYHGPQSESVFTSRSYNMWYMILALFLVVAMLYYFRVSRMRGDRIEFRDTESFWRCDCGRVNHVETPRCRRCGQPRLPAGTT